MIVAGLNTTAIGAVSNYTVADAGNKNWPAGEITRQIETVRAQTGASGEIHYHLRSIAENPALAAAVEAQYAPPALVPVSPWIAAPPPQKPKLAVDAGEKSAHARWENSAGQPPRWWLLQSRTNGVWSAQIFSASRTEGYLDNGIPEAISVRAVDRLGNLSEPAIWISKKKSAPVPARE
jgi:hypothetical protein